MKQNCMQAMVLTVMQAIYSSVIAYIQSFPKKKLKMNPIIFPGVQGLARVTLAWVMSHIQHKEGSQDPYPGLQEKSMNPFCVSFGKACKQGSKCLMAVSVGTEHIFFFTKFMDFEVSHKDMESNRGQSNQAIVLGSLPKTFPFFFFFFK